jgi:hypothetical protein
LVQKSSEMMTLDDLLVELATLALALRCPALWREVEQDLPPLD